MSNSAQATEAHPQDGPTRAERWPKIAAAVLGSAVVIALGFLLLPGLSLTSAYSASEQQRYAEAQAELEVAHDALSQAAGQAVSVLRTADQLPQESSSQIKDEAQKLRSFLNEEPPTYEAPAIEGLSREDFDAALREMTTTSESLADLAHKLARQAQKLEAQLHSSP